MNHAELEGIVEPREQNVLWTSCGPVSKLFRKELIKNDVKFPKGYRYEDMEFFFKICSLSKKVYFLDGADYIYRIHDDSLTRTYTAKKDNGKPEDIIAMCGNCHKFLKKHQLFDQNAMFLLDFFAFHLRQFFIRKKYKDTLTLAKSMLKDIDFPGSYPIGKHHYFTIINNSGYVAGREQWYPLLKLFNKLLPFPSLRRRNRLFLEVNYRAD